MEYIRLTIECDLTAWGIVAIQHSIDAECAIGLDSARRWQGIRLLKPPANTANTTATTLQIHRVRLLIGLRRFEVGWRIVLDENNLALKLLELLLVAL